MTGMFVGGIVWGILGDKRGRMSVLFGSIFIYSIANFLNIFVTDLPQYVIIRFVAGFGLAGELGAAITLVGEQLPKEVRGYGTSIVAAVGISGGVVAGFVGNILSWKQAYFLGGVLGILLLFLRIQMSESQMYKTTRVNSSIKHGNFLMLLSSRERFMRYLKCILIGVPLWYGVGILITFSPELGAALGIVGKVRAGIAIAYCYGGISLGDFAAGYVSQKLKSRKKAVQLFLTMSLVMIATFLLSRGMNVSAFYWVCFFLGLPLGYWALFVTVASEQFGTNLRSTVTTSVPNFVRGSVVPLTLSFQYLRAPFGILNAAGVIGAVSIVIAWASISSLKESFHQDLDFLET
jgi:MFS family permease